MRWPATGLSNPPLSNSTPRRATSNPHVLRVDPAGFRLVLHAADQRAAIGEDREPAALHVRDEDAARSTRRPERRQAIRDGLHVDRSVMDRVEGNRIAPAERSQDLRPLRPQILTFPLDTSGTIGAPPVVNPLDVRVPSVDHKEDPDRRRVDILRKRLELDLRVHGTEALRGGVGLRPVYIRFGVERLPLEIRELDDVSIDEPEVPNPRPGKQVGGDASQGPQTDHDGSCPGELSLALYTNLRKDFLSTISIG